MDRLADCWEWDRITGKAVFNHPPKVFNWRYVPCVAEMPNLVHGNMVIDLVRASQLVLFMQSDEMRTFFVFDTSRAAGGSDGVRTFMQLIRALNLNKVQVTYRGSGNLQMDKLPRNQPFSGGETHLLNQRRTSIADLQRDINTNALLGWLGPGTYPCHSPFHCDLCAYVGRGSTVHLGPHGVLELTTRATCSMQNVVYVGVGLRCEELGGEDNWCVYFGETSRPFRERCSKHKSDPCNSGSVLKTERRFSTHLAKIAELRRVINAGVDDQILRDWRSHVGEGGIHAGFQRMSVIEVIPLRPARIHLETGLVIQRMLHHGAIDYRGYGRGCVNTYHGE